MPFISVCSLHLGWKPVPVIVFSRIRALPESTRDNQSIVRGNNKIQKAVD